VTFKVRVSTYEESTGPVYLGFTYIQYVYRPMCPYGHTCGIRTLPHTASHCSYLTVTDRTGIPPASMTIVHLSDCPPDHVIYDVMPSEIVRSFIERLRETKTLRPTYTDLG